MSRRKQGILKDIKSAKEVVDSLSDYNEDIAKLTSNLVVRSDFYFIFSFWVVRAVVRCANSNAAI